MGHHARGGGAAGPHVTLCYMVFICHSLPPGVMATLLFLACSLLPVPSSSEPRGQFPACCCVAKWNYCPPSHLDVYL